MKLFYIILKDHEMLFSTRYKFSEILSKFLAKSIIISIMYYKFY